MDKDQLSPDILQGEISIFINLFLFPLLFQKVITLMKSDLIM